MTSWIGKTLVCYKSGAEASVCRIDGKLRLYQPAFFSDDEMLELITMFETHEAAMLQFGYWK